jgi:anti-sigma factor RsiW
MNCTHIRENLIEVAAGGPPGPEVLAHLHECSACAQEVDSMRKTMALLDEWEAPEPSPYFLTRMQAHVREEQGKAPARSGVFAWLRKPAMALSLAAVLVLAGITYRLTLPVAPPTETTGAVMDVESLDRNADLLVNDDLIDEMSGGPSDDVAEP